MIIGKPIYVRKHFTLEAAVAANIQLVGSDKGSQAVHDLIVAYQANRRTGSANSKTRAEVSGNNKKIFRQKGTGNARHGDKRSIFVGGGVVFGPRPCDYSKKVNKSTRRLALRRVLGDLIAASKVSTVSEFSVADGKTKSFIKAVKDLTDAKKVLIVAASFDETTYRAARNVQEVLLMTAAEVNIEQLMNADAVILVDNALETLASRTA
ncbi:MAG: 50S ribosomal protein L4 [Akkermansia sp.]